MVAFLPTPMPSTSRVTVRVAAGLSGIAAAADRLSRFLGEVGINPESAWPVHVALDEILSNIVRHGGDQGRAPLIDVTFAAVDDGLEVTVVDDGREFNPLQAPEPDDFVVATNETHTVKEFVEASFAVIGETIRWEGKGVDEKGYIGSGAASRLVVEVDPRYFRPTEVDILIGDYSKARAVLGWEPKITFTELVKRMMLADYEKINDGTKPSRF